MHKEGSSIFQGCCLRQRPALFDFGFSSFFWGGGENNASHSLLYHAHFGRIAIFFFEVLTSICVGWNSLQAKVTVQDVDIGACD